MGRLVRISDAKGPRSFGTGPRTEKQEPQVKPTPALPRADLTGLAYEALQSGTLPMTTPAGRVTVPTGAAAQRASMLRDYAQLADDRKRDRLEGELYQLTQPGRVYNQETTQRNRARAAEIQGELDGLLPRESGRFKSGVQSILSSAMGAVPAIAATAKSLDWSIGEERNRAESRQLAELDRKIRALEGSRRGDALDHIRGTDEWKALDAQRRTLSLQANPAVDMDDPGMRLMRESNQYREQALEGLEGVPRFLGGTALSIGQNAALLPLAAVNPALPLAAMGTISAADKMYELGERGLPASEALSRGLISGGIEAATEKIPLDTLLDAMKTGGKGTLRNILRQAGTEAGEESVSYLANYLADKAAKDPEAEFSLAELAQAAAGGALSGGVFGGFGSAYNTVGERLNRPVEMGTGRTEGTEETDPSAFGLRMTREERAQDGGTMVRDDGTVVRDDGTVVRDDGSMAQDDGRATPQNVGKIKGTDIGRTEGTDVWRTGAADALSALAEETARERTEAVFAAADAQAAQETAAAEDRAIRSQRQESPFPVQETPVRETAPPSSTAQARTQEQADALIATLGENGQKAFRAAYQAGGDLPAAFREFSQAYRQGVNGAAETDVAAGRKVNTLSAYYAGQNDAALSLKREKKAARFAQTAGSESGLVYDDFVKEAVESGRTIVTTEGERAVYLSGEAAEQVNQVARRLGLRVRFVDSIDVNGQKDAANAAISGAEVQIQKDNPNPVRFLMGHEMTHRMQELAPKEYRAFRSAAANDLVVQRAVQDQMARHARRGISLSYEAALDEAAADYAGRLVQDGALLDDFIRQHKENRSLLEKLRDAVRGLIRKLTGKDRAQAQTAEGKLTAALEAAARRAEKLEAKKNTAQEGGVERFSINDGFGQELREWFEAGQPAGELFTLGSTGPVLQGLGAIESDIYMNGDKISTILEQHPEMSIREIQRIPEMLEDPTLILKSKGTGKDKNNSRMVLYGSIKAQNGQPVLAVLDLRPRESGFLLNDMQKVNSTYTKNNPASFVTGSDVLYADKKRTVPLLRQFGLTIASRQLLRNGSMGSITYDGDRVKMSGVPFSSVVDLGSGGRFSLKSPVEETENLIALHNLTEEKLWGDLSGRGVNVLTYKAGDDADRIAKVNGVEGARFSLKEDSEGRKLTKAQREYFRDSKVVDTEGRLLVLYHGTTAYGEITKFRRGKYGWLGPGIYLASRRADAQKYADAMGEGNGQLYELYANVTNPLVVTESNPVPEILLAAYGRESIYKARSAKQGNDTRIITSADIKKLQAKGYDGIRWDFGLSTEVSVFSTEQLKRSDNTNPTEAPDIRYSLKEDTVSKSYAAILEENELLRERVDYWKEQTKQTRQPTTDKKAVDRAARDLVKAYSADLDAAEIAGELQALYDAMASGKRGGAEYSGEAASRDAGAIARKLVESAIVDDDTLYQDYSDLRQFLKGTKLTISETDAADLLDYNDLRKRNFGRSVISKGPTNVDQVYQELSERWPEFFDEARDTHPADQLQRIDDVLGEVYRIGETNPYAASMEEAVTGAANEILETFFDLPQTRKTFADRQAQKLDAARAKGQAQVQKVRAQRDARLAELREQNRARTAKAVERERTRREEQVARLRSRYEARDAAGRERRSARELRAKIVRHAKALSQKLLRPTDKQHVPEDLRTAVAAMLESINLESAPGARSFTVDPVTKKRIYQPEGTPTKRTEAFLKLKEQYQKIIEDGSSNMVLDPTLFGDAAENIKGSFDQVISMRDIRLADMNMEQLQTVWNVVRAVERSIATAGEAISDSKYTEIAAWANDLDRDTKGRKPKETLTETGLLKSLENPYTFFSHYGESGMAIYRMLRDAQDQQQVMRGQVEEAAAKIVDPKTVEKLEKETKTFELENGDKLTLTTAQVMEIYELMKRKQAYNHLLKGGIVQPKVKSAKIRRGKEAIHLTTGDLGQIAQSLTEEEIRIADGLQRLTNGLLAGYGNEASMKVYGYKKFTEDNYWPIHSSKEGIYARPENSKGNVRAIKNIGLAKTTVPHASNALDIGSIFDTFAAHAGDMIDYAAWLAPMEDAVRLFNFKFRTAEGVDTGRSVKGILDQYGGAGSQEYWSRLMENIQNGISASSKDPLTDFAAKGIGSFKGAAVGGNLRVVLQQPTAILRASAVLSPADMSKGLASGATKGSGWKKAVKWSPIAQRKAAGGFDISSPVQMKESLFDGRTAVRKLNDLLSSPAGKADAATWGRIWNACEWTVARKRPGLTKGSDDFYRAVNQVFTDVIDQTQVVDGVLQRSNIMRSPSDMAKMATSFMGEPTMSLNMFLRAWDQLRYEQDPKKRSKAIKNLGRVGTSLVVTNLVNAFAQSLVDGIRDDDKEKGYWERVLKAFTGLTGEEKNALEKAVSVGLTGNAVGGLNPFGMVPYLRDVLSLMQGYEVARTDTEVLSALVRAGNTAIKSAGGNGPKTRAYAVKEVAAAGAKLFGVPVSNITRDVWSTVRTIAQGTGNLELQYEMERAINNIGYSGNQGKYYTLAFQALQAGNTDLYRRITADLIAQGVKASSIESAMNKRLEDAVKKDPAFALSREAHDLIGARTAYAPEEEKEAAFGPNDLSPEAYNRYSGQRAKTYRAWADELEGNQRFQRLDDTAKDKVLTAAADLAEDLALRDHSGGKYQDADLSTWERWAAGGTGWGVDPVEALLFRAAYDMAESEIKDGKTVPGSKKENALELAETLLPRLSDRELEYLMSYYWSPEDKKLDKLKENKFLT